MPKKTFVPLFGKSAVKGLLCLGILALAALSASADDAAGPPVHVVPEDAPLFPPYDAGALVWDITRIPDREQSNIEFPNLVRFKGSWYCSFREGLTHGNHISGRGRVVRSPDGVNWETAVLLESETGDVRDPRLSVTSDGRLMVNASIAFIPSAAPYEVVDGAEVRRRSVTWLWDDGDNWSGPYACPTGVNTWRWDVAWHEGYGYSIGYSGKDRDGTLYRTQDGQVWEVLLENVFPRGNYNEAALAFGHDGTGYCLLRGGRGGQDATLGVSRPPYDEQWTWRALDVRWHGSDIRRPFSSTAARNLGGPNLIVLSDGRLLGAARAGGGPGGLKLYLVDPAEALLTQVVDVRGGSSYPGIFEHEGEVWFTYIRSGNKGPVYIARARVPGRMTIEQLIGLADEALGRPAGGFGLLYRDRLAALRARAAAERSDALRDDLRGSVVEYQAAQSARKEAEALLVDAREALAETQAGFGAAYRERVNAAVRPASALLADEAATIASLEEASAELERSLAGLRRAADLRASADASLTAAQGILARPLDGFGRLLQSAVRRRADALRREIGEREADIAEVSASLEELRRALGEFHEAGSFPDAPVIDVPGLPVRVVVGQEPQAAGGLLVNTRAEGAALTLAEWSVLAFPGGQSVVNFGNPDEIAEIRKEITISVWAYPESTESAYRTILIKGDGHTGHTGFYLRHGRTIQNNNGVSISVFGLGEPHDPYTQSYRPPDPEGFDHQWHHYALTYDGAEFNFYLDGERVSREERAGEIDLSDGNLSAGRAGREPWLGHIKDVRIWSTALAPGQIATETKRRPLEGEPELVGWWPLDEGEGDTAFDRSGRGNHGETKGTDWKAIPARRGWRLSGPYRFSGAQGIAGSSVRWRVENGDADTVDAKVLVGLSDSADSLPLDWLEAQNGEPIPSLEEGADLAETFLWVRQELTANDPSVQPTLLDLTLEVR